MAVRLSTLAEIKVLSLSTFLRDEGVAFDSGSANNILEALKTLKTRLQGAGLQSQRNSELFKTVGIARNIRIDENYGTQNIYGIGAPTRPRIVPNNYDVTVTAERLQLDRRDLRHFFAHPEYWYADDVQRDVGIDDITLYTYFFVRSKEDDGATRTDIFALMPRTSSKTFSSGDVMVANNVSLVGFKYSYEQAFFDVSNLIRDTITQNVALPAGGGGGGNQAISAE